MYTAMATADPLLTELTTRLVEELHPERVYLFGSRARNDARLDSDYDVLVVMETEGEPCYRLEQRAYHVLWGVNVSIDVLVWSCEGFQRQLGVLASLPATVQREGTLLYAA